RVHRVEAGCDDTHADFTGTGFGKGHLPNGSGLSEVSNGKRADGGCVLGCGRGSCMRNYTAFPRGTCASVKLPAMTRTTAQWLAINEPLIAEFRSHQGQTSGRNPVILLTTVGRKSGRPLVTPLNFSVDGDRVVAIASAGGAERHPAWYLNLVANPDVTIERGAETYRARATTATEPERTRL